MCNYYIVAVLFDQNKLFTMYESNQSQNSTIVAQYLLRFLLEFICTVWRSMAKYTKQQTLIFGSTLYQTVHKQISKN